MSREIYRCIHCGEVRTTPALAMMHLQAVHPEHFAMLTEPVEEGQQTAEEGMQEIFDLLKSIPLCNLTDNERRILIITQFHGAKV